MKKKHSLCLTRRKVDIRYVWQSIVDCDGLRADWIGWLLRTRHMSRAWGCAGACRHKEETEHHAFTSCSKYTDSLGQRDR